jgi:hypothetical protein
LFRGASLNIRWVVGNTVNVELRCFKTISDIDVFGYTCNRPHDGLLLAMSAAEYAAQAAGADAHQAFELSGLDFINTAGHADTIDSVDLGALRNEPTAPICTRSSACSTGVATSPRCWLPMR